MKDSLKYILVVILFLNGILIINVINLQKQVNIQSELTQNIISILTDQSNFNQETLTILSQQVNKLLTKTTNNKRVIRATVTAYSPRTQECDSTPYTTAFMKTVHPKYVAVSRDIITKLKWAPGQKIYIEDIGVRIIGDLMSPRIKGYHIDLFMWKVKDAKKFGKRKNVLVVLL